MDTLQIVMMSVWIVILVVTIILEFQGPQLETIWFTVGSVVALILAAFNVHYLIQIGAFVLVSVVLLIATRPLSKRFMQKEIIKTNADSLIGQHAIVTKDISLDHRGEVKINAVYWVAFVTKDLKINKGSKVVILGIEGNKLLVEPIEGGE
jgi:membrane protein implicated in regulation of membrane protease activity